MKVMRQLSKFAAGSAAVAVAAIRQRRHRPGRRHAVQRQGGRLREAVGLEWLLLRCALGLAVVEYRRAAWPAAPVFGVSHDSPVVGGQIGIQHQFGNFVLGIEGTLTVAFQDDHASTACPNSGFTCAARFDDVMTIGPRLGWAMGKWMPYVTGGYANAAFDQKIVAQAPPAAIRSRTSERHSGWFIGGGVDMALSHGWTIGLEYRHYEFDDAFHMRVRLVGLAGMHFGAVPDSGSSVDATLDTVTRAGELEVRPGPRQGL